MGHAQLQVDFNNAPDYVVSINLYKFQFKIFIQLPVLPQNPAHTLSTKISLARNTEQKTETTFAIEVTRPLSSIDLKLYVKYDELYKNGTEHTVVVLTRYSTNKEIIAKTSVFIPKGNLFGFDATVLLTVPDLGTCSASVKIQERIQRSYLVGYK